MHQDDLIEVSKNSFVIFNYICLGNVDGSYGMLACRVRNILAIDGCDVTNRFLEFGS